MKKILIIFLLLISHNVYAEFQLVDDNGNTLFLASSSGTQIIMTGENTSTAPVTCVIGQRYFKTNATAGRNLYGCTSIDTWTLLGDGTGGGTANILDLGDDDGNDSIDLEEIATTGDTNNIFTESAANKLLIAVGSDWPKADTSDDLTCTDCIGDTEITTHAGTSLVADLEEEVTEGSLADQTIVSADIKEATILSGDLSFDNALVDGDIIVYDSTGTNFEGLTCAEITGSADLCDGTDATGSGATYITLGSNTANSTTTAQNVTGLSFSASASTNYDIECQVVYTSAATTTGIKLSSTIPTTPTMYYMVADASLTTATAGRTTSQVNDGGTTTTASAYASPTRNVAIVRANLRNSTNAGTWQLRFNSEVATSFVTIVAGSICKYNTY